jgi:hypothetical protein
VKQGGPGRPLFGVCQLPDAGGTETPLSTGGVPLRLVRLGLLLLAVALAGPVLLAAGSFGPDSLGLPLFNSDAAIPVLMGNERHWSLFHAYYLGQDRFGAWPFLLAGLLAGALHRPVTPEFLHALSLGWLLLGAVPAMLLLPGRAGLVLLAYLIALVVPETRAFTLDASQPYGWQLPLLLWAWWSIRKAFTAEARRARAGWLLLSTLLCFFATWTSVLSGPLLLLLSLLEGAGLTVRRGARPAVRLVLQLLPAALGILGEAVLRSAYHRYVRGTFHRDFRSELRLDTGHLLANAGRVWLGLSTPLVLGLGVVLTLAVALGAIRRRRAGESARPTLLECTLGGALLLAVLPLPVLASVAHVRLNDFHARYFTPSYVFAIFGGLLALTAALPSGLRGFRGASALLAGTVALGTVAWEVRPKEGRNPGYARLRTTAEALAARAPEAVLLDGYWGTYVFAALAPPGQLLPLPPAEDSNRMPANEARLAGAHSVLVGHRKLLGKEGTEPRWLVVYGTLLERGEATFLDDSVDRFSLYRPRAAKDVPYTDRPGLVGLHLEDAAVAVRLVAEEAVLDTALAVEFLCGGHEVGQADGWALDASGKRLPLLVLRAPASVLLFLPPPGAAVEALEVSFARAPCLVRAARWYVVPKV